MFMRHTPNACKRRASRATCPSLTPGTSTVLTLTANPAPSDDQIADAMNGVICRCGTYQRIEQAIKSVAGGEA